MRPFLLMVAIFYLMGVMEHNTRTNGRKIIDMYIPAPGWLHLACGSFRYKTLRLLGLWMQLVSVLVVLVRPILAIWLSQRDANVACFFGGTLLAMIGSGVHTYLYQRRDLPRRSRRRSGKKQA